MIKISTIFIVFFLCTNGVFLRAQSFDHLYVDNGLSQSTVLSICQDARGFMWFGTRDGLNRYDSYHIKTYRSSPNNRWSISTDEYIYALFSDRKGNVWVGTRWGLNRYVPERDGFEKIFRSSQKGSISDNHIYCITQDSRGRLWFGTESGLNMLPNSDSRYFVNFFAGKNSIVGNQVYVVYEDKQQRIWIGTTKGLTCMKQSAGQWDFTQYRHDNHDSSSLSDNSIKAINQDRQGNIWIGTESGGLDKWHEGSSHFTHYKHSASKESIASNNIRKISVGEDGQLWIATIDGLDILNTTDGTIQHIKHEPDNPHSLSDNSIKDIYRSKDGIVWIGTMYAGVNRMDDGTPYFKVYHYSKYTNSISSDIISCMLADDSSRGVWIGTEGKGLNYWNRTTDKFTHYYYNPSNPNTINSNFIKAVMKDDAGNLWIGTYLGGIDKLNMKAGTVSHYKSTATASSLPSDNVLCLFRTPTGNIWAGTSKGLCVYDPSIANFRPAQKTLDGVAAYSNRTIRCIEQDGRLNRWLGTSSGVIRIDSNGKEHFYLSEDMDGDHKIKCYVDCIFEDHLHNVYIGTHGSGIHRYDPRVDAFVPFRVKDGLPSKNIMAIQEDSAFNLWITTDHGLVCHNPFSGVARRYDNRDGLSTNEFNANSACMLQDGTLLLGSYNGLVTFRPNELKDNENVSPSYFTEMRVFNRTVGIGGTDGILRQDITMTKDLELQYNQNAFALDFAALNYGSASKNSYAYRLVGFEKEWNKTEKPSAVYMNLPYGKYSLEVKGSNNDGYWGPVARLGITILPPWWKTWWAYLSYGVLFIAILYCVIRFFRQRARLERDLHYEHINALRKEEIYRMKLDFFTKISHEIRTPLTLILAPLDKMMHAESRASQDIRQLRRVKNSAERLLKLVGELLDFRKMGNDGLAPHFSNVHLKSFVEKVYESFVPLAEQKNVGFTLAVYIDDDSVFSFDPSLVEKALYNILSNAFKFTPEGGNVALRCFVDNNQTILFEIEDDGIGIAASEQQKIFEDFYQGNSSSPKTKGWGIGLSFAANIMRSHQGNIAVESQKQTAATKGHTIFTVSLPCVDAQAHEATETIFHTSTENANKPDAREMLPAAHDRHRATILLVEDNNDVREFLKESLCIQYNILEASNGKQGMERAFSEIPDIIISDVMMPEMDGLDLCRHTKTDTKTSHIPVILLTAKSELPHQIQGLETGADLYLSKPFSMQMLELSLRNIIARQEAMKLQYSQLITLVPQNKHITLPEENFLQELMREIEQRMENADFKVANLARAMGMSQTVLYKKIKSLTGMTITDLVKSTRLKRAGQLLQQQKMTVAEVAYTVGFTDPKYFGKEFKKQFGLSPSEYAVSATCEASQ
ncbi:MAG: two-component regulator propeller domain-containing protein [Chitinophagaceae bacterium]